MSTPDQPETPPLTRRRLREIRNTGATAVVPPAGEPAASRPEDAAAPPTPAPAPSAPLPRAAEPVTVAPPPVSDTRLELGVSPLTRRQARAQERIRTASVPVIAPDHVEPAPMMPIGALAEPAPAFAPVREADAGGQTPAVEEQAAPADTERSGARQLSDDHKSRKKSEAAEADTDATAREPRRDRDGDEQDPPAGDAETEAPVAAAVVNPRLGSELLAGGSRAASLPPSFDALIGRGTSSSGSVSTANALILSQAPATAPLVAPVTSTGEVLITGSFDLPEGLGSMGHMPGTADGKDIDIALVDGELPPASSPTPIAASAAISTVRTDGEIIRPPAPEKGNKLTIALVITAGALALVLAGTLIYSIVTGQL